MSHPERDGQGSEEGGELMGNVTTFTAVLSVDRSVLVANNC